MGLSSALPETSTLKLMPATSCFFHLHVWHADAHDGWNMLQHFPAANPAAALGQRILAELILQRVPRRTFACLPHVLQEHKTPSLILV